MKASAPEKIWVHELSAKELNVPLKEYHIEYTRTDVFIEKACEFLNKELPITDLSPSNMLDITFKVFDKESKKVFIDDFKNYMKVE